MPPVTSEKMIVPLITVRFVIDQKTQSNGGEPKLDVGCLGQVKP